MCKMACSSRSAAVHVSSNYCVGCGDDLTHRSSDRRSLQGADARIISVWKESLVKCQEESQVDLDADELQQVGKMCRKSFAAFDRYAKLQTSLLGNLKNVIAIIPSTQSSSHGIKRHQLDQSGATDTVTQHKSPDDAVSYFQTNRWLYK